MKRILLFVSLFCFSVESFSQCAHTETESRTAQIGTHVTGARTVTTSDQSFTANQNSWYTFGVTTGVEYLFDDCATSFDPCLEARQSSSTGTLLINYDDRNENSCGTGARESIFWTSGFTGTLYAGVHHYAGTWQGGTSASLTYRQSSSISNTTSNASLCNTDTRSLTYSISSIQCAEDVRTFTVQSGGGSITGGTTYDPGSFSGSVTIRATHGVSTSDVSFAVHAPPTAPTGISGTSTICSGGSTTLTATGGSIGSGATYQWYAGGCGSGSILGTGASINVSPTSTTTYYVRRVGNTTCTNTTACASVAVTVETEPTAPTSITGTTTICTGSSTTLTIAGGSDGSGATYQWYAGGCGSGSVLGTGTSISISPTSTTTYYVRRVGNTACTNTTACASVAVTVETAPTAPTGISGTTFICSGSNTTLTATGGSAGSSSVVEWSTGSCGGTVISTGGSVIVSPTITTTYYARRVDMSSCAATTLCTSVTVIVNGSSTTPTMATLPSATATSTCVINDNNWHHFYDSNGDLLASIFSNNQDLGSVTVTIEVGNEGPFGTGLAPGVCGYTGASGGEYALARNWDITVGIQPTTPVDVIFYYESSEVADLTTNIATLPANTTNYINCWGNVVSDADLMMTVSHTSGSTQLFPSLAPAVGPGIGLREVAFSLTEFSSGLLHAKGGIQGANPLPVELLSFEAKPISNEYIQLNWITATEINNDGFELLRSLDGMNFEKIAWVKGMGNSSQKKSYSYNDKDVSDNRYYYKLKQIDFDGESEEFNVISAVIKSKYATAEVVVRPIPTSNTITLDIDAINDSNTTFSVYSYSGHKVLEFNKELNGGSNSLTIEEISELSSGIFYLNFLLDEKVITKKFVVSK